jgi:hypothetical protein
MIRKPRFLEMLRFVLTRLPVLWHLRAQKLSAQQELSERVLLKTQLSLELMRLYAGNETEPKSQKPREWLLPQELELKLTVSGERPDWIRWRKRKLNLKWMQLKDLSIFRMESKGENWATSLGWLIPRKYRHVIGDILEDCAEMRQAGCTERRIKFHVVYQWLIAVITLVPTSVITSITDILKQVLSPPR